MNKIPLLLIALLISTGLHATKNFVVKKKKNISITTLKNNCCDSCTDVLQTSAQLIETIATQQLTLSKKKDDEQLEIIKDLAILQQHMLTKIRSIIENEHSSFFDKATKKELQECYDKTKTCHETLLDFNKKIKDDAQAAHAHICQYIEYVKAL